MKRFGTTVNGAVANLAAQGIPFLLLIVVTPVLLTTLGRERYGALILFNLVPQIAGQLDLGLGTAASRGFTQHSARGDSAGARALFHEALWLVIVWGCLLGGAFHAFHAEIGHVFKLDTIVAAGSTVYLVSAVAIPLALLNSVMLVPLRALERYGAVARIQVLSGVAYWTGCVVWATLGADLTRLVLLGTVIVALTTVAFLFVGTRRSDMQTLSEGVHAEDDRPRHATTDRFLLRPFLKLGGGAFLAQASSLATYHADKLLVSALVSPAAAGAYAICTSIANKILLVIASGATFTYPRSARLHAQGEPTQVQATYAFSTRISLLIAAGLAMPLIALAPAFLVIWLGPGFAADYAAVLRLLTIGYAISATAVVASNVAVGIGEVGLPATFALLGGAVTLISVTILAPLHGATGAALAALIGMSQAVVFNDLIARRLGGTARAASWSLIGKILLIATPIGVATTLISSFVTGWLSLLALAALSLAAFVVVWLLTFGQESEQTLVRQMLRRARSVDPAI